MSQAPQSKGRRRTPFPLRRAPNVSREQHLADMPDERFEAWCRHRIASASFDHKLERATREEVEADRLLRHTTRSRDALLTLDHGSPEFDLAESPLEVRMLEAFFSAGAFEPVAASAGVLLGYSAANGALLGQLTVKANQRHHRLDYAVVAPRRDVFIAIEIDGGHHYQREQAQRDRRRDRDLAGKGWTPIRFTGGEVFKDAEGCVREVVEAVAWRLRRGHRAGRR
jgi:very-short-patch-repair endonuclease